MTAVYCAFLDLWIARVHLLRLQNDWKREILPACPRNTLTSLSRVSRFLRMAYAGFSLVRLSSLLKIYFLLCTLQTTLTKNLIFV